MLRSKLVLVVGICLLALVVVGTAFAQATAVYTFPDGSTSFEYPADWVTQENEGFVVVADSQDTIDATTESGGLPRGAVAILVYSPAAIAEVGSALTGGDFTPRDLVEFLMESGELNGEIDEGSMGGFDYAYVEIVGAPQLSGRNVAFASYDTPNGIVLIAFQSGDRLSAHQEAYDLVVESLLAAEEIVQPTPTRRAPPGGIGGGGSGSSDGTTVEGELTSSTPSLFYAVELNSGDTVTIEMAAPDGDLDTKVRLFAPGDYENGGTPAVENDDSNDSDFGNFNSRIADFRIRESGTWVIEATSFASVGIGDFTLTIRGDEDSYDLVPLDAPVVQPTPRPGTGGSAGGSTVSGELTESSLQQQWEIELEDGDTITVEMAAANNSGLDTKVRLYAPGDFQRGRRPLAENDDSADPDFGRLNSRIADFPIDEAGVWVIEATSYSEFGTGAYTLTVRGDADSYTIVPLGGQSFDTPEPTTRPGRATPTPTTPVRGEGTTLEGVLTDDEAFHQIEVELEAGDVITVELVGVDGAFDPVLALYAPGETTPTIENDDSGDVDLGTRNSLIADYEVPEAGVWVIGVRGFAGAVGPYTLTIYGANAPYTLTPLSDTPAPEPTATAIPEEPTEAPPTQAPDGDNAISYNQPVSGAISRDAREVAWTFSGQAGDVVTITMVADDPDNLDTRIYLYTADAHAAGDAELIENDDSSDPELGERNSRIEEFELPETGDYVLVATCFVKCEGTYTLTIESDSAPDQHATPTPTPTRRAQNTSRELRQWASEASATTEYSETSWGAVQAVGEPDTEECADVATAWASADAQGVDSLTLTYARPVIPTQVNVYQTFNPGSITSIQLITEDGDIIDVPDSADRPGNTDCPGVFTVDITGVSEPVTGVIINVDQSNADGWNEIDAVELVGNPA